MDSQAEALLASAATISAIYVLSGNRRKLKKLPGPFGIPFFGNALQLDENKPHESLTKWADQYGDIYKISLFGEDVVVVNSYEGITELLLSKSKDYAGRPPNYRIGSFFHDTDVGFSNVGPTWSVLKKASSKGLKQVGEQLTELEEILSKFTDELTDSLTSHKGKPVDIRQDLNSMFARLTATLVYGRAFSEKEHEEFLAVTHDMNECMNPTADSAILDIIPWLRNPLFSKYNDFKATVKRSDEIFTANLNKTVDNFEGEVRCALDGVIHEVQQPSQAKAQLNLRHVCSVGINLTLGGILTTSSALYYFVALLTEYPAMQNDVHEHIVKGIGHRAPTLQDRFAIPLIEAMILELLRLMSHVPISVPHKALTDSTLLGYEIPKGTQIWPNLWRLHHDSKLWDDPWSFKPRRFLDTQGNLVKADHPLRKQFYAFGAGRRVCVGEALAKNRMFLFMVTLLQRFEFVKPEGEQITTDPREFKLGFVLNPADFKVILKPREMK